MTAKVVSNLAASSLALATALAAGGARAQTVITRSITTEPVETVITQTPAGTVVTRRPVDAPLPPAIGPTIVQPGLPAVTEAETVPDTVDAITTRAVVRRAEATRAARPLVTRQVSARPEQRIMRNKTVRKMTTARVAARPAARIALTPRERHIVYQTIVEREVLPRQQIVMAPPAAPAPYIAPPPYIERQVALPAVSPPVVAAEEEIIAEPAVPITIGTVLPPNVPLYAVPQNVALSVPAIRSYSYAWLGGRAYLVEPATGMVVADVTE